MISKEIPAERRSSCRRGEAEARIKMGGCMAALYLGGFNFEK
jgi:hypothetical protein